MRWTAWLTPALGVGLFAAPSAAQSPAMDRDAITRGNAAFAVDLYGQVRQGAGNRFLSPFSISTALAMTYAGSRGATASEMQKVLHFPLPPEKLGAAYGPLLEQSKKTAGQSLSVANALWCQVGAKPLDAYVGAVEKDYGGRFAELDFAGASETARKTINDWVEQETKHRIKDLFAPGTIDPMTRLVLTNAIYFKSDWARKFETAATREEPFRNGTQEVQVHMMHQTASFGYSDGGSFQVLELPYAGDQLSMVVFLPKKDDGLEGLEKSLTADMLTSSIRNLPEEKVIVSLPRFKMTSTFRLEKTLKALGMPTAFGQAADFSGMTGKRDLFIGTVVHKAFVEVNEEGTEAAGATGVGVQRASLAMPPITFTADHPFLFVIRDMLNDRVLFMGRVTEPE